MRLRELFKRLDESDAGNGATVDSTPGDNGSSTQGGTKRGTRGTLHHHHATAIPGLTTVPDWPGQYYNMYRMGVHMAGSPENPSSDEGVFANEMVFTTYTDGEAEILKHSAKELGVKLKVLSSRDSVETDFTNVNSPVASVKRNKYGI